MTFCFCGTPLAGKTTLSKELAHRLGLPYFSTGDYARGRGMGNEPSIKESDLSAALDGEITGVALEWCRSDRAVVDGFPRSERQLQLLEAFRETWGFEYRVVFVMANPALVFDRLVVREREQGRPEDVAEVVLGRLKRSAQWLAELRRLDTGRLVVYEGGYDGLVDALEASCAG